MKVFFPEFESNSQFNIDLFRHLLYTEAIYTYSDDSQVKQVQTSDELKNILDWYHFCEFAKIAPLALQNIGDSGLFNKALEINLEVRYFSSTNGDKLVEQEKYIVDFFTKFKAYINLEHSYLIDILTKTQLDHGVTISDVFSNKSLLKKLHQANSPCYKHS